MGGVKVAWEENKSSKPMELVESRKRRNWPHNGENYTLCNKNWNKDGLMDFEGNVRSRRIFWRFLSDLKAAALSKPGQRIFNNADGESATTY